MFCKAEKFRRVRFPQPELCKVNLDQPAKKIHDFVRGLDSIPGAWITLDGEEAKVFGSKVWSGSAPPDAREVSIDGASGPGLVHPDGLLIPGSDGRAACVKFLSVGGKYMQASKYGQQGGGEEKLVLTDEEQQVRESLREVWSAILKTEVVDETDFFGCGAGSMHVVQLVEEVKERAEVAIANEDVFMNTTFGDFINAVFTVRVFFPVVFFTYFFFTEFLSKTKQLRWLNVVTYLRFAEAAEARRSWSSTRSRCTSTRWTSASPTSCSSTASSSTPPPGAS